MLYNTHSHFQDKTIKEAKALLDEFIPLGGYLINAIGYDYKSSKKAIEYANLFDGVFAVCGIQPEEIDSFDGDYNKFIELFNNPKCVAIGEIGLDYYYGKENRDRQLIIFEEQLKIATKYKKPIMIHCRDAHEDLYNLLEKYYKQLDGIVLHCYTGSNEMAKRYLKLGAYISVSGIVTFKNAKTIKEVVANTPLDKLLIETDDPYLAPTPYRGTENHPSYVIKVAEEIANIKNMSVDEVINITCNNAKKVFHV